MPRRVLPIEAGWNDVGSWAALWAVAEQDDDGNACHGDVIALDCRNSYAWSERRLVAMIGLDDTVVVDTDDACWSPTATACRTSSASSSGCARSDRGEAVLHRKVYRPWGAYDSIDMAERFQVKRITVKPGAALSLQMHHHRAEHWIVVSGTARVTRGEDEFMLGENQSTFIPRRHQAPPGEPRQGAAAADRGAVRQLPGRGRHRALRGHLRPFRLSPARAGMD